MALFRLFGHSSINKKKDSEGSGEDPSVWRQHYESVPENCQVRVVLFRECQRKGQKLLFDSRTVRRQRLTGSVEVDRAEQYKEQTDGWGYRYLSPPAGDVRQLHEMILGGAGVVHHVNNLKLHLMEGGLMWSSVLQPPHSASNQPVRASDQSLGSTFGSSIGSFSVTEPEMFGGPQSPPVPLPQAQSLPASDSGYYSSYSYTSLNLHTLDSQSDLSSHADLPDYGSWCSLQRRWASVQENSLSPALPAESLGKEGGRPKTVLGLALIVQVPDTEILLRQSLLLENIFSQLSESVMQAYTHKRRFVSILYSGYSQSLLQLQLLCTIPHLPSPTWHLALTSPPPTSLQQRLVQDILSIRAELDTKETNFFFSSLLTGVLSHHLGWVETVMPSSEGSEGADNSLCKPHSRAVEEFSQRHWYTPTKLQHQELHGMIGFPARNVRTLVIANTEIMAKKIVFVLAYFIRCSQIIEKKMEFPDSKLQTSKYRLDRRNPPQSEEVSESQASCAGKGTNLAKSSSSPTLEPRLSKQSMKKSKSFICSLSDLAQNDSEPPKKSSDRVNFLIGDNENLNINPDYHQETLQGVVMECEEREEDLHHDVKFLDNLEASCEPIITKGVTTRMKDEDEDYSEFCEVTEVMMSSPQEVSSSPASLPSLICCSHSFMPGSVLQACHSQQGEAWRSGVRSDLMASTSNSSQETICLLADVAKQDVRIVSAQQVVTGGGLPVPLSPLVANILDTFASTASLSLPASVVLTQLEDNLQQLYLQSCILAELLLSQDSFHSLQTISSTLDLDPCDVPLLLAVAATHTPAVGHKYGLSFAR